MSTNSVLSGMAAGYAISGARDEGRRSALHEVNQRAQEYYNQGFYSGIERGKQQGYQTGWDEGWKHGEAEGWNAAVAEGNTNMDAARTEVNRLRNLLRAHNITF